MFDGIITVLVCDESLREEKRFPLEEIWFCRLLQKVLIGIMKSSYLTKKEGSIVKDC